MLAATLLGVFLIPALYVITERIARSERKFEAKLSHEADEPPTLQIVEGAQ
jgi:hypothetical protein